MPKLTFRKPTLGEYLKSHGKGTALVTRVKSGNNGDDVWVINNANKTVAEVNGNIIRLTDPEILEEIVDLATNYEMSYPDDINHQVVQIDCTFPDPNL